jgi:cilia- and flagella-associated protein 57
VRKPFIVTCSQDKTVRIWNYQERRQEIFEKFHQESEAVACAIHPSGFHIIVGFQDKIKLMNVFTNKLKPYHNIPLKQFREVVFSNGGHMFAAAHNQQINVYNFYTCETPTNYKAHSNKIKSICWYEDDSGFISSDMGGSIYEWSIKDVTPGPQYYSKGTNFTCVLKIPNEPFFYAVGSDKLIKEIKKGQVKIY